MDWTDIPGRVDQTGLALTLIWPSSCEAGEGDTCIMETIGDTYENRRCELATNLVGCRSACIA